MNPTTMNLSPVAQDCQKKAGSHFPTVLIIHEWLLVQKMHVNVS